MPRLSQDELAFDNRCHLAVLAQPPETSQQLLVHAETGADDFERGPGPRPYWSAVSNPREELALVSWIATNKHRLTPSAMPAPSWQFVHRSWLAYDALKE